MDHELASFYSALSLNLYLHRSHYQRPHSWTLWARNCADSLIGISSFNPHSNHISQMKKLKHKVYGIHWRLYTRRWGNQDANPGSLALKPKVLINEAHSLRFQSAVPGSRTLRKVYSTPSSMHILCGSMTPVSPDLTEGTYTLKMQWRDEFCPI